MCLDRTCLSTDCCQGNFLRRALSYRRVFLLMVVDRVCNSCNLLKPAPYCLTPVLPDTSCVMLLLCRAAALLP